MGYSNDEAYAFLSAIGERGRRYYANRELLLDMFYPPLYAISRVLADDAGAPADIKSVGRHDSPPGEKPTAIIMHQLVEVGLAVSSLTH